MIINFILAILQQSFVSPILNLLFGAPESFKYDYDPLATQPRTPAPTL